MYEGGSGPPLLLLHSGLGTWRDWRPILPALEQHHHVIAPTSPGSIGGPPLALQGVGLAAAFADHAERVLDARGVDGPVRVAGSSFGGVVALEMARRGRVRSAVALAPPYVEVMGAPLVFLVAFLIMQAILRPTTPLHGRYARSRRGPGLFLHGSSRPTVVEPSDLVMTMRSMARFPLWLALRQGGLRPAHPDYSSITCPITIVRGTKDRIMARWMLRRWATAVPEADLVEMAGLPHHPQLRDPAVIAELILSRSR